MLFDLKIFPSFPGQQPFGRVPDRPGNLPDISVITLEDDINPARLGTDGDEAGDIGYKVLSINTKLCIADSLKYRTFTCAVCPGKDIDTRRKDKLCIAMRFDIVQVNRKYLHF